MLNYLHKSNNVEVHESVLHIVLHQRQQTMHQTWQATNSNGLT